MSPSRLHAWHSAGGLADNVWQYLSLPSRHFESAVADLARTHSIAITGTIVHGTSISLPAAPNVNPFGTFRCEESTKQWTTYIQDAEQSMKDTSHLSLLNEAFFFDAEGQRRGTYVKKNLWHPERCDHLYCRYSLSQVDQIGSTSILAKITIPFLTHHGAKPGS